MKHKAFLFLITFALLSPTLTGDAILWDDLYLVSSWQTSPVLQINYFSKLGMPWQGWLHYFLHALPHPLFLYKLLSVVSWSATSVIVYLLLSNVKNLTNSDRFFIALISTLFPGYNLWFSVIQMPQPLYISIFLLGCYYYHSGILKSSRPQRLLGIVLILPTFALQSLYVFVYGLLFLRFWYGRDPESSFLKSAIDFAKKHYLIILLPVVQFLALKAFFRVDEIFENYNIMQFDGVLLKILMSFGMPLINIPRETWTTLSADPFLLIALVVSSLVIFVILVRICLSIPTTSVRPEKAFWLEVLKAGLLLALFAVFPYSLVNKPYLGIGYTGRFSMLLSVPVALIFYSSVQLIIPSVQRVKVIAICILCSLFTFLILKDQILWQTRYIKYRAIIHELELKETEISNLAFFHDKTTIGKPTHTIYFEWNWMMYEAWGNKNHFGFSSFFSEGDRQKLFTELEDRHYYSKLSHPFFQKLMLFNDEASPQKAVEASLISFTNESFHSNIFLWANWVFGSKKKREYLMKNLISIEIQEIQKS
ncbi:MAG: hypothetical protein HWE07_10890 [Cytophagia bacterium]|nr:hypothetical protein [Cytophagia bacterium]